MMKLTGTIECQTDKAIFFSIRDDICLNLQGRKIWFPKSKINLPEKINHGCVVVNNNFPVDCVDRKKGIN